jgi:dihydrofolate reductase/uncharacterized damage-inducible protein DinB
MGRLVVWNVISLDGYFEGPDPWDLELHQHIWGPDLRRLSLRLGAELGLLVFGRTTYEGMAAHWAQATEELEIAAYMNAAPKLVASRTMTEAAWHNTEVTDDIVGELTRRKQLDSRPISVFGSAELTDSLLDAGLVDELLIGVSPVILGRGTPLFKAAERPRPLDLIESSPLDTGGVLLRYAVPGRPPRLAVATDPERDLLASRLAAVRHHVLGQLDGLTDEQLREPRLPSGWSLAGLLKHLTIGDEHYWFACVLGGDPLDGLPDDDWHVADDESIDDLLAGYRAAIERADQVLLTLDLDAAPRQPDPTWERWGVTFPTARHVVLHVLVELATHAGHIDTVRELIDDRQWLVVT